MSVIVQHSRFDQPIPHPILDNSSKMMRLIANPVYDKLTKARAAGVRKYGTNTPGQLQRERDTPDFESSHGLDAEEVTTTPLPHATDTVDNIKPTRSKSTPRIETLLPRNLQTTLLHSHRTPRSGTPANRSRASTARSRASTTHERALAARARARARPNPSDLSLEAIQDELIADTAKIPKPMPDHTIRYVKTRHGFEVQYYSSRNWLSTDVYTKETLPEHEQTFREMLERKRLHERLSRNIYSSEYYSTRLGEMLQSYKQGNLTHAEWAKQSYQLHFLKTLYIQALKREHQERQEKAPQPDAERPGSVLNAPADAKDGKSEENLDPQLARLNTPFSHLTADEASFISNTSLALPTFGTVEDAHTPVPQRVRLVSISTNDDGIAETRRSAAPPPTARPKTASAVSQSAVKSKTFLFLDDQRWSLKAMVRRVVGLSDQVPSQTSLPLARPATSAGRASDATKVS